MGAECAQGAGIGEHVFAFQQPGNSRITGRERCQNQRAVRDGLVSGNAGRALETAAGIGTKLGQRVRPEDGSRGRLSSTSGEPRSPGEAFGCTFL